jgi:hypothetical protein
LIGLWHRKKTEKGGNLAFDGFGAAFLIEDAGLSARLPGMGVMLDVASSEVDGALDAALRQVGQAERGEEFEYEDRSSYEGLNRDAKEGGTSLPTETQNDGTSCG